jgi:flagellar biosynthesis/type III secretory pathway ATPase
MATYAVQFVTRDGALCGQTITNRGRAILLIAGPDWTTRQARCVVIVVTANSSMERFKMKATAISQVFHERGRAMDWLKSLGEEQ